MRILSRWYSALLRDHAGTTLYVRRRFPEAVFRIEKRVNNRQEMIRHVRFELRGKTIVHAQSRIDLNQSRPEVIRLLNETDLPIGEIIQRFHVRRTRQRSTSRTRETHFSGDLHARVLEHYYLLPRTLPA